MNIYGRWLAVVGFVAAAAGVSADTVYLVNGGTVQGTVLEETPYSVKVEAAGRTRVLYRDQIDRVERDGAPAPERIALPGVDQVPDATRDMILGILRSSGVRELVEQRFYEMLSRLDDAERTRMEALVNVDEVMLQMVPVYAAYFSPSELEALSQMYQSEAFQKHRAMIPELGIRSVEVLAEYFSRKMGPDKK